MTGPTKKLGDVCDFRVSKNTKFLPYVGMEDVESETGKFIGSKEYRKVKSSTSSFDINCVLYGKLRPYLNKVFIPDFEGHCSTEFIPLRPDQERLDRVFLSLWLRSGEIVKKINTQTSGSRMPRANMDILKNLEIPLPPISEQKKIVARIEKLFAKIDEAARLRDESQEATDSLLSSELHKIFEEGKKKGWEEKEIKEICELNPKKSEIKDKPDNFSVSFVPMSAVDEYLQKIVFFAEKKLREVRKGYTYFRDGDVLFAKITPCMENGKVAIAENLKNGIGFGTTEFHVIRAKEKVLPRWIYYIIRQPLFRDAAKKRMTGSAGQKRVPIQFLATYKILLPLLAEQKKIVVKLDALSEKIRALRELQSAQSADLKYLKQSILHQAFFNTDVLFKSPQVNSTA